MRILTLTAGIAAVIAPAATARSAVFTVGGPLSQLCYQSAVAKDARSSALDGCTRALDEEALQPRDRAATLVNRGIIEMISRHDHDADADFDAALALDRNLADAWLNKGFLRLRQGDGREALAMLQRGIDLGPKKQALAIFARGVAYEQMGQFQAAYVDLKRAQEMEPGWSLPTEYLARYQLVPR